MKSAVPFSNGIFLPLSTLFQMKKNKGSGHTQDNGSAIQHEEWKETWETEFRGDGLNRLELKFHSISVAVTKDESKTPMSRIIPVVQSSGTGKSRLAEE
jgi:hypothetical protein